MIHIVTQRNAINPFFNELSLAMKNGSSTIKLIKRDHDDRKEHDKPPQIISKAELHQNKNMLSIWWDYKGVVYF